VRIEPEFSSTDTNSVALRKEVTMAEKTDTISADRDLEYERESTLAGRRVVLDLHDEVMQPLFAAGMGLHSAIANSPSADTTKCLRQNIDDLQAIVDDIRHTIHLLQHPGAVFAQDPVSAAVRGS
jgi:signal transduction histidine kinase